MTGISRSTSFEPAESVRPLFEINGITPSADGALGLALEGGRS